MRIAIVGTGISGMVAAYLLCQDHDVVVFEANDYIGGHTNTIDVEVNGANYPGGFPLSSPQKSSICNNNKIIQEPVELSMGHRAWSIE